VFIALNTFNDLVLVVEGKGNGIQHIKRVSLQQFLKSTFWGLGPIESNCEKLPDSNQSYDIEYATHRNDEMHPYNIHD